MTDKNHEQYLEQIEIAVAETTKELMSKHNGDLRAMAKVCAEKQVEINRLKEYYSEDKKTIRNLRVKLKEAVDEIECRNSTWETKEKEYEGEIVELKEEIDLYKEELDIAHHEYEKIKEEIEEIKDKIENLEATNKMMKDSIKECKEGCDGGVYGLVPEELYTKAVQDINQRDFERTSLLKEIEKYKEYPQQGGWEKALDNLKGMKDLIIQENHKLGKENEELKKEIELQKDYIGAIPDNVEEYKDELHAVMGENRMLKEEIDAVKEEKAGICSKYHADFCELEEKRKEIKELKKELEKLKEREFRMCDIANANGWDIYPTDSEEEEEE